MFRNIIFEIQELPTKKPDTFMKGKNKKTDRMWSLNLLWKSRRLAIMQCETRFKFGEKIMYTKTADHVISEKTAQIFV